MTAPSFTTYLTTKSTHQIPLSLTITHPKSQDFHVITFNNANKLTDVFLEKVPNQETPPRIIYENEKVDSRVYVRADANAHIDHEYVAALHIEKDAVMIPAFLKVRGSERWRDVHERYLLNVLDSSDAMQDEDTSLRIYRMWQGRTYEDITPAVDSDETVDLVFGRLYGQELLLTTRHIPKETLLPQAPLRSRRNKGAATSVLGKRQTPPKVTPSRTTTPGHVGLASLGNTCYMNSAVQALTKTPLLKDYFLSADYKAHIARDNKLGTQGRVVEAFAKLMNDIWRGNQEAIYPFEFKQVIGKDLGDQFAGQQQQDASELLRLLIDALHEDLNQATAEDGKTVVPASQTPLDELTQSLNEWSDFTRRNKSFILNQFGGQFRDQITCNQCGHKTVRFTPMTTLNLPIPTLEGKRFRILLYRFLNPEPPTEYGVELDPKLSIKDLREALSRLSNVKLDEIVLANMVSHQIFSFYNDDTKLSVISASDDIVAYQIPGMSEADHKVYKPSDPRFIEVRLLSRHVRNVLGTPTSYLLPFGQHSLLLPFRKDKTTQEKMYKFVWQCLQRYFSPRAHKLFDFETPELFFPYDPKRTGLPELVDDSMMDVEDSTDQKQKYKYLFELRTNVDDTTKWSTNENCLDFDNTSLFNAQEAMLKQQKGFYKLLCVMEGGLETEIIELGKVSAKEKHPSAQSLDAPDATTLAECMGQFSKETTMADYRCPHCKEQVTASCKSSIWKAPEVLVVLLKRFKNDSIAGNIVRARKIYSKVSFPLEWRVEEQSVGDAEQAATDGPHKDYKLFSVINHFGSTEFGHYTCCTEVDNEWVLFDDATVKVIDEEQVKNMSSEAYVLMYKAEHQ